MKLRNDLSKENLEELAFTIDNDGFWYSLTAGGYLSENILAEEDRVRVRDAIYTLEEFEALIPTWEDFE